MSFTFNANGLLQTAQDPLGDVTTYLLDQVNRLTTYIDPLANRTSYSYDVNSRLTNVVSPIGSTWTMGYDQNGRSSRHGSIPRQRHQLRI